MKKQVFPQNMLQAVADPTAPGGVKFLLAPEPPKTTETERKFLDVKGASKYCSLSRWSFSRAVRAGQLKCFKMSQGKTGKLLFDINELQRFIESHAVKSGEAK